MRYPGHDRVDAVRTRLAELRHDTDGALREVDAMRAELDEMRRELAALTVRHGEDIAALTDAVERLRRERGGCPVRPDA